MSTRGIAAVAAEQPERPALLCDGAAMSYGELDTAINRAANALHAAGVGPGDRVAVRLQNGPEIFVAWNAAARLGALVVPVSTRLVAPEVAHIVGDSGAVACIHDDSDLMSAALREGGGVRALLHRDDPALHDQPPTPPNEEFLGAWAMLMSYTSGTTGRPKGVRRPPPPPARVAPPAPVAEFWGFTDRDVHLLCGPAYHTGPGAYAEMHLVEGGTVVIMRRFDATECLRLIEEHRVTTAHMVPANFVYILEAGWRERDLSSVRRILHAAAPCPVPVKRRILEVFPPGSVWEYYGASEGIGSVISPEEWLQHPGSVGRAFPGVELRILGEDGAELPPGEVGTIYIAPPSGHGFEYHNNEPDTRAAWRDAMFTVGDLGWLDEDGYLFIADRRDDLIIRGGVNIYPAEVERELAEEADVLDAAVIGLPDPVLGQSVHAVVQLRPGAPRDGEALRARLGERLAGFKLPRTFDFVEQLPREPTGKVNKRRLRAAALVGRR